VKLKEIIKNIPSRETDNNGHSRQMAQINKLKQQVLPNSLLPISNKAGDYQTKKFACDISILILHTFNTYGGGLG
jgi:hypothetical protein